MKRYDIKTGEDDRFIYGDTWEGESHITKWMKAKDYSYSYEETVVDIDLVFSDPKYRDLIRTRWYVSFNKNLRLDGGIFPYITFEEIEKDYYSKLIIDNSEQAEKTKMNKNLVGWFMGKILKEFKNCDPKQIKKILEQKL
jgi:hypothetical protein